MAAKDLYEKDFYKILGVEKTSSGSEIKKKYRTLARELHPDKNKGDKKLEEQFKKVSEAYDILSNEKTRSEYDEGRALFARAAGIDHRRIDHLGQVKVANSLGMNSREDQRRIFSPISLEGDVAHGKGKIYRLNRL